MKNTDKQTKKKLEINWPTSHFTIQDIQSQYPDAKNITLRYRINKAIEEGQLTYIGKNDTKVGRPTIVIAPYPVSTEVLESAVKSGVILDEQFENKVVDVLKVTDETKVDDTVTTKSKTITA